MEAYHPAEAAAAAVRWLRENPAELVRARVVNVLVDDGQAMGRASQVLACLLAGRNLVMVWDTVGALPGEDDHPYGGGLEELIAHNGDVTVCRFETVRASRAVADALARLGRSPEFGRGPALLAELAEFAGEPVVTADGGAADAEGSCAEGDGYPGGFSLIAAPTPGEESDRAAAAVAEALAQGVDPDDILVVAPTPAWRERVTAALEGRAISWTACGDGPATMAALSPEEVERVRAALALVAGPRDPLAWRCWCGQGDPMAGSSVFSRLYAEADAAGEGFVDRLVSLAQADGGVEGTSEAVVAQLCRQGLALVDACAGLCGRELVDRLAQAPGHGRPD